MAESKSTSRRHLVAIGVVALVLVTLTVWAAIRSARTAHQTENLLEKVKPGMTAGQVHEILGKPSVAGVPREPNEAPDIRVDIYVRPRFRTDEVWYIGGKVDRVRTVDIE